MILNVYGARRSQMSDLLDLQPKADATKEPAPEFKHTSYSTNFSEKSNSKKEKDTGRHRKKPPKKKTPKKAHRVASDVDVNAVPNPAPESEPTRTFAPIRPTTGIYTGVLPVYPPVPLSSVTASTSGFSPLPPLAAFATTVSTSASMTHSTSATVSTPVPGPTDLHAAATSQPPQHLSVVVIVLIAVGSAFLLVMAFVVFRMCNRPRKHSVPTPSLPILQDPFQDEKRADPDEESLFGGKERASVRSGNNNVLLDWTQYPHTSMVQKPTVNIQAAPPSHLQKRKSRDATQGPAYLFKGIGGTQGNLTAPATHRVSMHSVSVYPGSPVSTAQDHDVGIAVGGSPLTADNNPVLQRSNSKSARRMSQSARSVRQSVISTYGASDLYGVGSPIPATPKAIVTSAIAGRARVQASYAPGVIRASATGPAPMPARDEQQNPFEETQYVLPPLSPMTKSDDRRERDTKALTSALGLASPAVPMPVSPQMTLYPDDSITLAGDRRRSKSQLLSPTVMDDNARLGKFMMGDFQSMASLPSTRAIPAPGPSNIPRVPKPVLRKRVEEKPPRVPSPPPLPSLAQMAMAHTNPQDFDDYRSPTYSIYGLYESDRKSRTPGEGGY